MKTNTKEFKISRIWLGVATIVMLITATYDTLASKFQNRRKLPGCPTCEPTYFESPMFQTVIGYIGCVFCLIVYFIESYLSKKGNRKNRLDLANSDDIKKPKAPVIIWALPALADLGCTLCLNIATNWTQASIVQIIVVIGTGLTGFNAMLNPDKETNHTENQWLGIFSAVFGTCLGAVQFLIEEAIFRYYHCSPFESIGLLGTYATFLGTIILAVFHYIGYEDFNKTMYQLFLGTKESVYLLISVIIYVFSVGTHTVSGIIVTKLASCLLRVIINSGRIVTVYFFAFAFGWERFMPLHLISVIVILTAIILYNYSFINEKYTNCCSLDAYVRKPVGFLPAKYEVTYDKLKIDSMENLDNLNSEQNV